MEPKIIEEFLSSDEIERFLKILEITLQCRSIERQLALKKEKEDESQISKHMSLLLHAQICRNKNFHQNQCQVRHCEPIRRVLEHALNCKLNENCQVKYCRTARRLALHYETCHDSNCQICNFACQANELKSEKPRQIFFKHSNESKTVHNIPCGSVDCGNFNCNPFRMQNPPNKVGQTRKTNCIPISDH